jgi:Protein of unknown function (DUF3489)
MSAGPVSVRRSCRIGDNIMKEVSLVPTGAVTTPRRTRTNKAQQTVPARTIVPVGTVPTKADMLVALLSRDNGATIVDMMTATGWMAHSVRGFMAGALRKRMGHSVTSEVTDAGRVYRLAPGSSA